MKRTDLRSKLFKKESLSIIPLIVCLAFLIVILFFKLFLFKKIPSGKTCRKTGRNGANTNKKEVYKKFLAQI